MFFWNKNNEKQWIQVGKPRKIMKNNQIMQNWKKNNENNWLWKRTWIMKKMIPWFADALAGGWKKFRSSRQLKLSLSAKSDSEPGLAPHGPGCPGRPGDRRDWHRKVGVNCVTQPDAGKLTVTTGVQAGRRPTSRAARAYSSTSKVTPPGVSAHDSDAARDGLEIGAWLDFSNYLHARCQWTVTRAASLKSVVLQEWPPVESQPKQPLGVVLVLKCLCWQRPRESVHFLGCKRFKEKFWGIPCINLGCAWLCFPADRPRFET